jgi:hypothetical protein
LNRTEEKEKPRNTLQEGAKQIRIALKQSKKAFDLQWLAKQCDELGERLHTQTSRTMRQSRRGYTFGGYCEYAPL